MRVAVIGSGAAGLCALRLLKEHPRGFHPVGFELSAEVGGTWNYTDKTGTDERGLPVQSSMYKNLRTNLPKEIMAFPDFPFDSSLPSFIHHTDVAEYLRRYAQHFDLYKFIKFKTLVEHVSPVCQPNNTSAIKWNVTYSAADNRNEQTTEEFESVIVCNGHYSTPLIPDTPGLDVFEGEVLHSHNYRTPSAFRGRRVVLLGAGASGQDISIDVSSEAKEVFLSSRKAPLQCQLPENVHLVPGIKHLKEKSVVFENDQETTIDSLLFCTGYKYTFPFLDPKIGVKVDEDQRITPLYKHLVHSKFPSLFLIGLCKTICPFPQFHVQISTVMSILSGKVQLPSRQEMEKDEADDLAARMARGLPRRHAHEMGPHQWEYNAQLVQLGGFQDPIPVSVKNIYDYVHRTRVKNLIGYKKEKYTRVGNDISHVAS
ncbi:uncharacterized protein [Haliotis cracherodii]|uniref:uncharacterized protein n=1 Tax=Haliotis cracherodii TaxID=6455 RepID=UPI0039ECF6AC